MAKDHGLQNLLDLDGETFQMDGGFWAKFEVKQVEPTAEIPHGIRYSLTLHDRHGTRILGFDNAHAGPKARKYGARKVEWDHRHDKDRVTTYRFSSAGKLVIDFWTAVDSVRAKR
jgi:hypothetical protein